MSDQTTETLERTSERESPSSPSTARTRSRSKSGEVPSWSELANKGLKSMESSSFAAQTLGFAAAGLALGFGTSLIPFLAFSIPGGWLTTMFLVTLAGSLIGKDNIGAAGAAGATVAGVTALFGGLLVAIFSLGLSVVVAALLGGAAGVAGAAVGKAIRG